MKRRPTLRIGAVCSSKDRHSISLHLANNLEILCEYSLPSLHVLLGQLVTVLSALPQSIEYIESGGLSDSVLCIKMEEPLSLSLVKGVEKSIIEIRSELRLVKWTLLQIGRTACRGRG